MITIEEAQDMLSVAIEAYREVDNIDKVETLREMNKIFCMSLIELLVEDIKDVDPDFVKDIPLKEFRKHLDYLDCEEEK